jgi:hypothetical protein
MAADPSIVWRGSRVTDTARVWCSVHVVKLPLLDPLDDSMRGVGPAPTAEFAVKEVDLRKTDWWTLPGVHTLCDPTRGSREFRWEQGACSLQKGRAHWAPHPVPSVAPRATLWLRRPTDYRGEA